MPEPHVIATKVLLFKQRDGAPSVAFKVENVGRGDMSPDAKFSLQTYTSCPEYPHNRYPNFLCPNGSSCNGDVTSLDYRKQGGTTYFLISPDNENYCSGEDITYEVRQTCYVNKREHCESYKPKGLKAKLDVP